MADEQPNFHGLRVAGFESRRADDLTSLINRMGGVPSVSPSMREAPLGKNPAAIDFANRLMTGQIDVVVFMTGVGVRYLMQQIERHVDRKRFLETLTDIITITRGPKPTAALKELGITPTHRTPEPNTWREVLVVVDERAPVANHNVGLLEYGQPNTSLIAGLEARGAAVVNVKIYAWELPEDTGPLENNIRAIVDGRVDVAMFTSSHQVTNLLSMAERLRLTEPLHEGLKKIVIASIGPDTSETLRQYGLPVDIEPEHSALGHLVVAATRARELLDKKRRAAVQGGPKALTPPSLNVAATSHLADITKPGDAAHLQSDFGVSRPEPIGGQSPFGRHAHGAHPAWHSSALMKACRLEPTEVTPVWLMRQAGRYMPEYRAIRDRVGFLELCKNPALATEVMVTAVERLKVDAAIVFSDLLPILEPMGLQLEFAKGDGPKINNPVREPRDVDRVRELDDVSPLNFVFDTVRTTRAALRPELPLIGFAGAPFTLASYIIEGGASRNYLHAKSLMYQDSGAWNELLGKIARSTARYLKAQIAAGAQVVQLFDSWVGCLGVDDYRRYVLPHTAAVIAELNGAAPVINFATGNPALLPLLAEAGGEIIGVDWRIELDDAWRMIGPHRGVQGNLDPALLLADPSQMRRRVQQILDQAAGRPGHIFNLGHGILPQTPVEHAAALVETVHQLSAHRRA